MMDSGHGNWKMTIFGAFYQLRQTLYRMGSRFIDSQAVLNHPNAMDYCHKYKTMQSPKSQGCSRSGGEGVCVGVSWQLQKILTNMLPNLYSSELF